MLSKNKFQWKELPGKVYTGIEPKIYFWQGALKLHSKKTFPWKYLPEIKELYHLIYIQSRPILFCLSAQVTEIQHKEFPTFGASRISACVDVIIGSSSTTSLSTASLKDLPSSDSLTDDSLSLLLTKSTMLQFLAPLAFESSLWDSKVCEKDWDASYKTKKKIKDSAASSKKSYEKLNCIKLLNP